MQENRTRYPSYDVLKEKDHWDDHTREIVLKRLGPFPAHRFLQEHEADMIEAIARHIVYEERKEILAYVVHYLDETLSSSRGESERLFGTPEQKTLVRQGLEALDRLCEKEHGGPFLAVGEQRQLAVLAGLHMAKPPHLDDRQGIPSREFFKKLATAVASAYYSHPVVWSEIGFGGPAYPRGYIRVEKGLTDAWEAKRDANEE